MINKDARIGYLDFSPIQIHYERTVNPKLSGVPFGVVGRVANKGLVVAVSREAYNAGLRAGLTPDSAGRFLPDLKLVEERPALYYKASQEVNEICERFIPLVDPESQDKYVLDMTGTDRLYPFPEKLVRELQKNILSEARIPSRVGLGSSRLIARLASKRADDLGMLAISPERQNDFLADYPVTVLPGVGTRIAERLKWMGVYTVRQLTAVPSQTLEAAFGVKGIDISGAAHGHDPRSRRKPSEHRSLHHSVILEQVFYDPVQIKSELRKLVAGTGLELRRKKLQVRSITLGIRYPDTPPVSYRKSIPPTDLDTFLFPIVEEMYLNGMNRRVRLRGLSLTYSRLIPGDDQLRLEFARVESLERICRLERAIDQVRIKYGVAAIELAAR